jgi:hypothetical protein
LGPAQHLLEGGEAAAAELLGHVDGLEAELAHAAPLALQQLGGQLAAVQLGLDLVGEQLVHERPGRRLDLPVGFRHGVARLGHGGTPGAGPTLTEPNVD